MITNLNQSKRSKILNYLKQNSISLKKIKIKNHWVKTKFNKLIKNENKQNKWE